MRKLWPCAAATLQLETHIIFFASVMATHVRQRGTRQVRSDINEDAPRRSRRSRNGDTTIDPSSLATVRELLREVRRLEDEVRKNEFIIFMSILG